jgi:TPR repeat protein
MMRVTHLIVMLVMGILVPLTSYAGADEIRQDALKGDRAAQYEMGILYEFGFHLAEHETEALAWYSVAAERGSEPAARRRDLLSARLSATQRAKAEDRRREIMTGMPVAPPVEAVAPATEAATPAPISDGAPPVAPPPPTPAPPAGMSTPPAAEPPTAEPAPQP